MYRTCLAYSLFAPNLETYEGRELIEDPHLMKVILEIKHVFI